MAKWWPLIGHNLLPLPTTHSTLTAFTQSEETQIRVFAVAAAADSAEMHISDIWKQTKTKAKQNPECIRLLTVGPNTDCKHKVFI